MQFAHQHALRSQPLRFSLATWSLATRWILALALAGAALRAGFVLLDDPTASGSTATALSVPTAPSKPKTGRVDSDTIRPLVSTPVQSVAPAPDSAPYGVDAAQLDRIAALPASHSAEGLIGWLRGLKPSDGGIGAQEADKILRALQELAGEGVAAIPAIYRFLQTNEDVLLGKGEGGAAGGYETLRLAFIETLGLIGGPEAETVLANELSVTAMPAEVALLADILDDMAPGYYQEPILGAVRETLAIVAAGPVSGAEAEQSLSPKAMDTAPLFEILPTYADAKTAAELERLTARFGQYAPLALGNLPQGQGVAPLARMVSSPNALDRTDGQLAMRMLAQVAADQPAAREVLLDKVDAGEIPASFWPMVAEVIAGDHQLQITNPERQAEPFGSTSRTNPYSTYTVNGRRYQRIYSVHRSATLSADEAARRLDLLSSLRDQTSDPVALAALNNGESLLLGGGY